MVQVGYSYYSQCYDLKSKKQKALYPQIDLSQDKKKSPLNLDSLNYKNAEIYLIKQDPNSSVNLPARKLKKRKSKKIKKDVDENDEEK